MTDHEHRVITDETSDKIRRALAEEGDFTIAWSTRPDMEVLLICPAGQDIPERGTVMLGPDGVEYEVRVKSR